MKRLQSTLGRLLKYSGKNNNEKMFFVTVFVDSVSKEVFCEFQYSTYISEIIKAKQAMERYIIACRDKIKYFCVDNSV